jgi:hypothetical protein
MEVVGGGIITIVSLLFLTYVVTNKATLYPSLLLLFYIYTVIGHAKTGITGAWLVSDFTYIISNILVLIYVINNKKINYLIFFSVVLLLLSFVVNNENRDFDALYKVLSSVLYVYLVSILVTKINGSELSVSYSNFFIFSFFALFSIFLVQAMLPYHGIEIQFKRDFSSTGGIDILGFLLNRPTGVSGTAHNAGNGLLIAYYFAYRYSINTSFNKFFKFGYSKYILFFSVFLLAGLSQRIYLLALAFFVLYFLFKKMKLLVISFLAILMLVLSYSAYDFERSNNILDRSNTLKISIWSSLITTNDYTVKNILVGNGYGSIRNNHSLESYNEFGELYSDNWATLDENAPVSAHNVFVELLYESGVVILLVFIIYLFKGIRVNVLHLKEGFLSIEFLMLIAFLLNYLVHNGVFTPLVLFMILAVNINTPFAFSKKTRVC